MIKKYLTIALILGIGILLTASNLYAFPDTSTWTLDHSELYDWYLNSATGNSFTKISGSGVVIAGTADPGAIIKVEVKEEVFIDPMSPTDAVFSYTVFNACYSGQNITSFHIYNQWEVDDSTAPDGWTFSDAGSYMTWSTNDSSKGISHGNSLNEMKISIDDYLGWDYFPADVDVNGIYSGNDNWVTSAPAPEPASLLLIGAGLLGMFGLGIRKKM